ncbi:MAG: signal peptidase I [Ruminococcus sp.]|nr:signal peptidase I [Ruminococcus sp.]
MSDEELEAAPEGGDGEGTETAEKSGFAASVGKVFSTLTTFLIVVLLGFMVYATAAAARGKIVTVFGHCLLTVITGSMEPTLHVGDFIFVEKTDPAALREGDIIAFWSEQQDIYGMLVTHRIVKVTENGFVTRGDANPVDDSVEVAPGRILGRYTGKARLFRWASSFGDLRKLMLLIVMIGTTIAAFYEVRTIGRLKHKIDEEKQSKEEEREQLIREAIEREKERLAAEGFGAVPAAEPSEEAEIPAETEESSNESAAEEAETPAETEESSNESAAEEAEIPAETEESAEESTAEESETPAEADISAEGSSAEEPKAEDPVQPAKTASGGAGKSSSGSSKGSKNKKKKKHKRKKHK